MMPLAFLMALSAHIISETLLPWACKARQQNDSHRIALHALSYALLLCLSLGSFHFSLLSMFVLVSAVGDKSRAWNVHPLKALLSAHAIKLGGIFAITLLLISFDGLGWASLPDAALLWTARNLSLLAAILLCVPFGSYIIESAMRPYEVTIPGHGLKHAGKHIGWLERSLVLLLVWAGQPAAIGFIITAKSILRFGEIRDGRDRSVAEYIIIGTFLSFGWALAVAYGTLWLLGKESGWSLP